MKWCLPSLSVPLPKNLMFCVEKNHIWVESLNSDFPDLYMWVINFHSIFIALTYVNSSCSHWHLSNTSIKPLPVLQQLSDSHLYLTLHNLCFPTSPQLAFQCLISNSWKLFVCSLCLKWLRLPRQRNGVFTSLGLRPIFLFNIQLINGSANSWIDNHCFTETAIASSR